MVQLNKNNITNQYLYGQLTTPANLVDDSLIRPKNATTDVHVDVVEYVFLSSVQEPERSTYLVIKILSFCWILHLSKNFPTPSRRSHRYV
jgi:hypothetical protein